MRAPPHFREELHPEEIVRRPPGHPWLGTIAVIAAVVAAGMLLRALDVAGAGKGPAAGHAAPAPASASESNAWDARRLASGEAAP